MQAPTIVVPGSSDAKCAAGRDACNPSRCGTVISFIPQARTFYRRPLPSPPAIPFASAEGKAMFRESLEQGFMEGYFRLAEQFVTQVEPAFCGLSSLAMVLNALEIDPRRTWKGAWRWFDEKMLDCCESNAKVEQDGIEFHKLAAIAVCNGATVLAHRALPAIVPEGFQPPIRQDIPPLPSCHSVHEFREDVKAACLGDGSHVIVSYSRKIFLQTGDGHFSPIGGYHPERDMILILDVARFKYPPHWVKLESLWESMRHVDKSSGLSRGYMHLKKASTGRGHLLTLSTQRALWQKHLQFFSTGGLETVFKSERLLPLIDGEAGQAAAPASGASKLHTELDLIVQSRPGPSVAVLNLHPADPCVHPQEDPRRLVVEALRGHGLTAAVQEALNRAGGIAPYDDALSLCGRGGRAEGLWVKEEEEALLLTVLLLISPENQWALASPELRALREIDKLPALAHEEVTSLRAQLGALIRFGCMCGSEDLDHDCPTIASFAGCTNSLNTACGTNFGAKLELKANRPSIE
eukprot:CAMPEP_0114327318 /NCGR_PEP_ID=MMETSP0059-20121206/30232_1 /TAXON_ID=36894 /ORGANISM="Pyramimonas parkeae, Strain CCMP726" /LENGTH=522 /DNA_ID=CAMNT_0001456427 /DNA_START=283 /DNA_END=1851 /DNA_ORIENTATION=-